MHLATNQKIGGSSPSGGTKIYCMKIREMGWFLKLFPIMGITLAPFGIYIEKEYMTWGWIINHEKIHWKQQLEMLIIFFYLWYLIEWGLKYFKYRKDAYYNISFEREAIANEFDLKYLETRKHYSWFKLIVKK